jgi:hypothetical protein
MKAKLRSDDLRPEYDFSSMAGGVRGKYVERLRKGSNVVVLAPDVAAAFPSGESVNEALRALMRASKAMRQGPRGSNKAPQRTARSRRR